MIVCTCVMKCEYGKNICNAVYVQMDAVIAFRLNRVGDEVLSLGFGDSSSTQSVTPFVLVARNVFDIVVGSQKTGNIAAQTYGNMPTI